MKWKDKLLEKLIADLKKDETLGVYIEKINCDNPGIAIHLAIFSEPILTKLLEGTKTLESRFSTNRISPHGKISKGDFVLVKKTGGPIVAAFIAGNINSYSNLTPSKIETLRNEYSFSLGLSENDEFWDTKNNSKYATLIGIKKLKQISPYYIEKKDRTSWVIIKGHKENEIFE